MNKNKIVYRYTSNYVLFQQVPARGINLFVLTTVLHTLLYESITHASKTYETIQWWH